MATDADTLLAIQAAIFEFGFGELKRAYDAVMATQDDVAKNAEAAVRQRWGLAAGDEPPPVTHDDEGVPSDDFWEQVGELKDEASSTASILQHSFLSSLFHLWEKHTNLWVGRESYNHVGVIAWLKAHGYIPKDQLLKALELAANCSKHGPGRSCRDCFALRQDLFDQNRLVPEGNFVPSANNLKVSRTAMEEFFEAVQHSGLRQGGP